MICSVKSNQSSPLLRLPPEIRNRIWEYTLGGVVFRTHTYWGRRRYRVKFKACENESNIGLALLRTCRQIYSETATMPIRLNTMACLSVLSFENAAKQLQPYQRKYITKIRIETYGIGSDIMQKFDHRLDFPTAFPGLKLIQIIAFNAANPRSPLTLDEFEARIRKIFGLLSNSSAIQLKVIECKTAMPTSRREFCWA